ncbi:hypothetical protein H5410_064493 [Solanum commersonii]|uniref:Uncharacterized protein n=1 Tax=Solanum commersonii TaxID=4109 RepID=A0A9J5VZ66_SOLCO|nr:hypothetical protein H5410_064493 [Solanum commersonii]
MSFPQPAKVPKKLDRLRREFLWFGTKEGKGSYLVNWRIVQLPKSLGGLRLRNLKIQNECLLMKWLWRYVKEDQALWKEVIQCKYGQDTEWCSNEATIPLNLETN